MDVARRAAELRGGRIPHAVATVVRARRPSSGKPGDRAIVTTDHRLEGWVGGACVDSVVVAEGLAALAAGEPRYVVVDSDATGTSTEDDRVTHPLHCDSGGAVELFIEPFTPPLTVVVVGESPVARTLTALCDAAGFQASTTAGAGEVTVPEGAFVVVATMGKADESAARTAMLAGAPYVAVVASRRRAAALRRWLTDHGVPAEAQAALRSPAGLDLGARTGEGIAVGILAEMVAERARLRPGTAAEAALPATGPNLVDPVCGMTVPVDTPLTAGHGGRTYRFCSDHCRQTFLADPAAVAGTAGEH